MPPKSPARLSTDTLPLPAFLRLLCSSPKQPLTMSQAMAAARHLVPAGYNSAAKLQVLTQEEMKKIGIEDEEIRKGIALLTDPPKKGSKKARRSKDHDLDKPLPTKEVKETVDTDLDFDEIHAEEALIKKSVVINRAPVMLAWATIVAERLGFRRQEALSIGQVYTSLNATSKGVSLGIYDRSALDGQTGGMNGAGSAQPFVDLMGRKVPVLSTADGEWRAISSNSGGVIASPAEAFAYLQRGFRQQLGAVMGGMRVLAESFGVGEVNQKGYALYLDFRPQVEKWGEKGELKVSDILNLRRFLTHAKADPKVEEGKEETGGQRVKVEEDVKPDIGSTSGSGNGDKPLAPEKDEFDALLDDDDGFDLVDV